MSNIKTDDNFWDYECDKNYIHSKNENICNKCGMRSDECPDSRINEIKNVKVRLYVHHLVSDKIFISSEMKESDVNQKERLIFTPQNEIDAKLIIPKKIIDESIIKIKYL